MTTFHEALKSIFSEIDNFFKVTLASETLSKPCQKEKIRITSELQRLYVDYEYLDPASSSTFVDEGSAGSKDGITETQSALAGSSQDSEPDDGYSDNIADTTVKALTDPIKIGFLQKKSNDIFGKFLSRQKRYCVLHKNIMYWFKKPGDKKQEGSFFITGYELKETGQTDKKDFSFELVHPGKKKYQFLAESKEDLEAWKIAIATASVYPDKPTFTNDTVTEELEADDVYEPIDETAEEAKRRIKEQGVKPAMVNNPESTLDNVYDGCETPQLPVSPVPPPSKPDRPPVLLPEEGDEVYEAVDSYAPKNTAGSSSDAPSVATPHKEAPVLPPPRHTTRDAQSSLPSIPVPQLPPRKRDLSLQTKRRPCEDFENLFYGLWNCDAATPEELNFRKGEIIHIINRELDAENWWIGELSGKIGLVPKVFLTPAFEVVA